MTVSGQRESSDVTDGSSRENTDVEGSDWPVRTELTGNGLCNYSGLKYESKYVSRHVWAHLDHVKAVMSLKYTG